MEKQQRYLMHQCEFCHVMFEGRPQVKRPRACRECQGERQKENEKAWHRRNKGLYDLKYHQIQKAERFKKLKSMTEEIFRLLEIGKSFLGVAIDLGGLEEIFQLFFISFGIRKINKLWLRVKTVPSKRS
jgi:hypothetical protein